MHVRAIPPAAQSSLVHLLLLSALTIPIVFWNLGENSLHNADEALYASVSAEILETNQWLTLHHQGKPWFVKAPLLFWLTAGCYKLFGISEFTARLGSATFAVATVLALYWLAAKLFDTRVAFLASLILLTCTQFIYYHGAKAGELDTALTFFMTSALLMFLMARREPKYLYIACLFVGLAAMSKHLTYLIPVSLTLGIYVALTGFWKSFSWRVWGLGLGIVLVTALPWHLAEWILHGNEFLRVYFLQEVYRPAVDWRSDPLGSWFYFITIKDGLYPWSFVLPFALAWAWSRRCRSYLSTNLLLVVWTVVLFVIITASVIKLSWYILPAYPALAILTAQFMADFTRNHRGKYLDYSFLAALVLVLLVTKTEHNPFAHMASHGMAQVQFSQPVQELTSSLGILFPIMVAAGLFSGLVLWTQSISRLHTGPVLRWLRWGVVSSFAAIALYHVTVPLKYSDIRSPFHVACQKAIESSSASRELLIALPRWKKSLPTYAYYFSHVCPTPLEIINPWELATQRDLLRPDRVFLVDRERLEGFRESRRIFQRRDTRVLYENEGYMVFEMSAEWNDAFQSQEYLIPIPSDRHSR